MSDTNALPTPADPQSTACDTNCCPGNSGVLRAVLYTPIVLFVGGLAAMATFPDLAQYAGPLLGEPECASRVASAPCAHAQACSVAQAKTSCSSESSSEASPLACTFSEMSSSEKMIGINCCPESRISRFIDESANDTATKTESSSAADEPADALTALGSAE